MNDVYRKIYIKKERPYKLIKISININIQTYFKSNRQNPIYVVFNVFPFFVSIIVDLLYCVVKFSVIYVYVIVVFVFFTSVVVICRI